VALPPPRPAPPTPARLLEAAAELFAARGYERTTIRDIALRAGVNVAAGHYHFGSKLDLYLEVARAQFGEVGERLAARGSAPSDTELGRATRAELERMLAGRIETMLEFLLGPPPSAHGAILQREMCDPSDALPVIVRDFVLPQKEATARLVARLAPHLTRREVERCVFSIVGQIFFHRQTLPILPQLLGTGGLPRDFVREVAGHVTRFSLAGIAGLEAAARRRARPRGAVRPTRPAAAHGRERSR
jgi:AcrR family transcriptional regulator